MTLAFPGAHALHPAKGTMPATRRKTDMADDFELDIDDLQRRMDGAMANLRTEFGSLRTGRASASMLEPVTVDAYGQQTPINQVGTVNVPNPEWSR